MTAAPQQTKTHIIYPACPLCDAKDMRTVAEADCTQHGLYNPILPPVMTWKQCNACGHIFTEGYFTDEAARIIFSKTHDNQALGHDLERQRQVSARMVERVIPFVNSGDWLDVGFGNGSLLFTAHEFGFHPVGLDLREANVAALKKGGFEGYCADIATLDQPGRYSVISLADVLEHMPYPKTGLAAVHRLLKKDGVALISMPNADSILWHALTNSKVNPYWQELEHFHNFGRVRLYKLLQECGFTPLKYGISERYRACMEIVARKA